MREIRAEGPRLIIRAGDGARVLPRLMEVIVHAGIDVVATSMSHISLEDVFIQLTGRSLREEHVSGQDARRAAVQRRRLS